MSALHLIANLKSFLTRGGFNFPNAMRKNGPIEGGFTLIELLIVVAIIGILTSIAVSSYNTFNRNQTVRIAALDLKSDLRVSKTDASAGKKHADCRVDGDGNGIDDLSLIGYYITLEEGSTTIVKGQRCRDAAGTPVIPATSISSKKLSQSATIAAIEGLDSSGGVCHNFSAGDKITVEYYTVAVTGPSGLPSTTLAEPNTAFYTGAVASGVVPTVANPCLGAMEALRLTLSSASANQYYLYIQNNGNVYEKKV